MGKAMKAINDATTTTIGANACTATHQIVSWQSYVGTVEVDALLW